MAGDMREDVKYQMRGAILVSVVILVLFASTLVALVAVLLIGPPGIDRALVLQIVNTLVGTLIAMAVAVPGYFLGSSSGSTIKNGQQRSEPAPSPLEPLPAPDVSTQPPAAPSQPAGPVASPSSPPAAAGGAPPWYQWGLGEIGRREEPGNRGPAVQEYIDIGHSGTIGDPWCAIWVNACLEATTFRDGSPKQSYPGTRSPSSQSYRSDPHFVRLQQPAVGALAVFYRDGRDSGKGHVGFYHSQSSDGSRIWVLGGNEDDMVQIEALPTEGGKFGLIGYWWPRSAPPPLGGPVVAPVGTPSSITTRPDKVGTRCDNIVATVFSGEGDPQQSAYSDSAVDPHRPGCALPSRLRGQRPDVVIQNAREPSRTTVVPVVDVGPWNTDDPYWETGSRPQAESGTDRKGRKTNGAGIDLTPKTAADIGIDGKGLVNWWFAKAAPSGSDQPRVV